MVDVDVVDEPDLVGPIAVEIEREEWAEPQPGHYPPAEVLAPQQLAPQRVERQLQRVAWEEEHLGERIDVEVRAVEHRHRFFTPAQRDRHRPQLPDLLPNRPLGDSL